KKTIGVRIPEHRIAEALINELGEPLLTSTLILPGDEDAMADPYEIRKRLDRELDLIIDGGVIDYKPTTVIACVDNVIEIVRQGIGLAPMLEK
ncbi:MAG: Sua5/YciO/YrdC/YwlC family protein, partial [Methylomonas sp.]